MRPWSAALAGLAALALCACEIHKPADHAAVRIAYTDPPTGAARLLGGPDGSEPPEGLPNGGFELLGGPADPPQTTSAGGSGFEFADAAPFASDAAASVSAPPSAAAWAPSADDPPAGPEFVAYAHPAFGAPRAVAAEDAAAPAGRRAPKPGPLADVLLFSGPFPEQARTADAARMAGFPIGLDRAALLIVALLLGAALWTWRGIWLKPRSVDARSAADDREGSIA